MKIKEVIVVEGKNDLKKVKQCVEADIIISHGTHVSNEFLDLCSRLNKERGIIIFTDPDGPGEQIRQKIMNWVGDCKHASLSTKQSKKGMKVGIEHASCSDIIEALSHVKTYSKRIESLSIKEFRKLRLSGFEDSQSRRNHLSKIFHFPVCNAKRCFQYLNMMGYTYDKCKEGLSSYGNSE